MENKTRNDILGKARLIYGLLNILEYDIDNIKNDVLISETSNLSRTIQDANTTLDNLIDVIAEMEYRRPRWSPCCSTICSEQRRSGNL